MNKKSKVYRTLSCLRVDIKEIPIRLFSYICCLFPLKKDKIVIDSPGQRETNIVTESLVNDNRDFDIVLAIRNNKTHHEGTREVKADSFRYAYELMTAGVWIDNRRKKNWIHKRKGQLYIQTWHGAMGIKKVEKDAEDVLPAFYVKKAIHDSKMIDYFVAETQFWEKIIRKSFWYNGELLRGEFKDGILNHVDRHSVIKEMRIDKDIDHIILYVPTFRLDSNMSCYNMDYAQVIDTFEKKFGDNWGIIIRLHPNIADKSSEIRYDNKIYNGTFYPELGDLINISDVVITDYSSCMFYGFRARKKVFIYASDFDDYMGNDRGGYFEYDNLPAPLCKTNEELENAVKKFDEDDYLKKTDSLNQRIGYYENDVMEQIMDIIHNYQ